MTDFKLEDGTQVNDIPENYTGKVIDINGTQYWFEKRKLHKVGEPAVVYPNKDFVFWFKGKRHNTEGKAINSMYYPLGRYFLAGQEIDTSSSILIIL